MKSHHHRSKSALPDSDHHLANAEDAEESASGHDRDFYEEGEEDAEEAEIDLLNDCEDGDPDWDVFLADDDERDPLPEYGDFWDEEDDDLV